MIKSVRMKYVNEQQRTDISFLDLVHEYEEELNRYYEYTIPSGDTKTN